MDLLHMVLRPIIVGALVAFVSWLSITVRKRKVARAEAAAPAPVEDRSQTLLRQAQQFDSERDSLEAQGQRPEALARARAAADSWRQLAHLRPGRFQTELQAALTRLDHLQKTAGHA
ncbi:hypothetical protein FNH05_33150 [Amycolatopsis rhizosphaerae]|uniref:Uncharacterized protein n=1 Tax=Amycolatopsis rhizosphaerae TaxID=2053003 RepID=A0A558AG07_9PSEU|nr:hypothetical protein [Amycolatopsis rhizosphaerae]TVT23199.1 hypothetical protein FNH05_33150 [Amycolatopsis rhizosphaerae]